MISNGMPPCPMRLHEDEAAGVTDSPLLMVAALVMAGLMVVALTADPVATGTDVGDRAPELVSQAYDGAGWATFNLESYFDESWVEGEPGSWIILEFMDTDCPYCVNSAEKMGDWDAVFDAANPEWGNEDVQVIAVVAELNIDGHDSSREEIQAFRDKTQGYTCAKQDCNARSGAAHNFPYVDDLGLDAMDDWDVRGTPTYFVIQPDGIIAWNSDNTGRFTDAGEAIATLAVVDA